MLQRLEILLPTVLLCVSYASSVRAHVTQNDDVTFQCCSPAQWTARVRAESTDVTHGVTTREETWMTLHYDSQHQRVAYTDVTKDGRTQGFLRTVEDFKNHSWAIVVDQKLCVIYNLTQSFQPRCTPRNMSLVLFAVAPVITPIEGVFANTVYFRRPDVTGHMTVTVGDCALVEEVTYDTSRKDRSTVDRIQYLNQTSKVDDSVFTIPDYCVHVPPDEDIDSHHWIRSAPRFFN
ncbi:uncharacterized protein LOC143285183 [Babylonia areolata]|uniref:uncharacterized protein LOC143285183 n=1 Tax=Babylonia areolata TaxID=304850 RepID=UPI003FD6AF45